MRVRLSLLALLAATSVIAGCHPPPDASAAPSTTPEWVLPRSSDNVGQRPTMSDNGETTPPATTQPRRVSKAALARLPKATTHGVIRGAPRDTEPQRRPSGLVAHPRQTVPVFTRPGGPAIAALPVTQLRADTWVPVVDRHTGWVKVLLPARPNGATGWLAVADVRLARTDYRIDVNRARFTLTLYRDGKRIGGWTAGVGKPGAVTPAGRTFVLAVVRETKATFSDYVLPLGAHSDTHTSYGGGPGTVGIHTWPTSDGFGTASSDGCVRVPSRALDVIRRTVPLGTPVMIR